ncbi:MAG: hypothetical protein E6K79_10405 [Candidatus Eisenbacteria bacterium]|uniref:EfeO-type cupredoxin-like domain-containing protein n=1 Tax=Eiseniibacteriota bacterium TaxID=2212470 RepID=A0A538TI58_UNCEI|nr:MAG: hypothetical protein E6K79_10405 [Candidatus Eisenbacteria bacterium]
MRLVLILLALFALAVTAGCNQEQKSPAGQQVVQLAVTDRGFEPPRVEVPRGQALTLVITRKTDQTCSRSRRSTSVARSRSIRRCASTSPRAWRTR